MPKSDNRASGISASSSMAEIRRALSSPNRAAALSGNDLVMASEIAGNRGKWDLGILAVKILVEREPNEPGWHHRLAHFLMQSHDLVEAETHCLKAIALAPTFLEAYILLRAVRFSREDYEGVLQAARDQESRCGGSSELSTSIALLLLQMRRLEEALATVRQINDVGPPSEASLLLEAEIAQQLEMPHAGASAAERAYRLWPMSAVACSTLARLLCHLGQHRAAVPVLRQAHILSPHDPSICYLLALALTALSESRQALDAVLEALALEPRECEYLYTAASLYDRLGEQDQALDCMRRAIDVAPERPYLRVSLAHMLSRSGDFPAAVSALVEAERLAPADTGIRDLRLSFLAQDTGHYVARASAASDILPPMPKARAHLRGKSPPQAFTRRLQTQVRVLAALIWREFRDRSAHSRFGILSVFIPMALQIVTLGVVLSLFNNGRPPIGDRLFFFYATGVMPFYLFIHVIDHAQNQFLDKAAVLQVPIITRLDVVLAVAITELLIITAVIVVTFGTFSLMSYGPPSDNQIQCVFAMLAVWLFAFGLGLICAVMTNLYRPWANGWLIVQRFLYVASGVFFIPLNMPGWIREPLSWNPLLQCIEWFRTGLFMRYDPPWLDKSYVVGVALATTVVGLMLERALRRKMRTQ
jgi:capsular polysaccharide transport system permease protein